MEFPPFFSPPGWLKTSTFLKASSEGIEWRKHFWRQTYHGLSRRYKFYLDEAFTQTAEIENTSNPEFHHERNFSLPVTKQLVDYLLAQPLIVEVWGSQAQLRAAGAAGAAEGGSRVIANATIEKVEAELRYYRSIVEKGKAKLEVSVDCAEQPVGRCLGFGKVYLRGLASPRGENPAWTKENGEIFQMLLDLPVSGCRPHWYGCRPHWYGWRSLRSGWRSLVSGWRPLWGT